MIKPTYNTTESINRARQTKANNKPKSNVEHLVKTNKRVSPFLDPLVRKLACVKSLETRRRTNKQNREKTLGKLYPKHTNWIECY